MIGYSKKIKTIFRESAFDKKKKKPGIKGNRGVSANRRSNNWALESFNKEAVDMI